MPAMQNRENDSDDDDEAEDDDETGKGFAMSEASLNYLVKYHWTYSLALLLMKCGIMAKYLHVHSFMTLSLDSTR